MIPATWVPCPALSIQAVRANSTSSLSIYAYKQAYENNQMGYAMAVAIITLLALIILFGPFMRNSARGKDD